MVQAITLHRVCFIMLHVEDIACYHVHHHENVQMSSHADMQTSPEQMSCGPFDRVNMFLDTAIRSAVQEAGFNYKKSWHEVEFLIDGLQSTRAKIVLPLSVKGVMQANGLEIIVTTRKLVALIPT